MLLFKSVHKPRLRRAFALISTFSLAALLLFLSYSTDEITRAEPLKSLDNRSYLLDTPGCRIPDWDPYDPSVRSFFHKISGRFNCSGRPSPLLVVSGGAVRLNHTLLASYYAREDLTCTYRPIVRYPMLPLMDSRFAFRTPRPLPFDTPLGEDFILVDCPMADFPNFTQFLPLVPLKPAVEGRKTPLQQAGSSSPLNIIMVGIDSVSRLNFHRHFRKTHMFLEENLSYFQLKGYTKVADNTFPNLVPLLTGHFVEYYLKDESERDVFFDDLDFIWKNFSERGYRTLFAEDAPRMATFNYLKKGFRDPPADYYYRPFALAIEKSLTRHSFVHCLQSKLETEILFDYLKSFVQTMQQRLLFAFAFTARLTHNILNAAGYADEPTFRLLAELRDMGALNRSLLILFSDHGIRFGPIRLTYIGKFEERMPFVYLSLPSWFLEQRPDLARNLRNNQNRLTTPFDIHATLAHLLNLDAGPPSTPHGLSLLGEVSEERTCEQAAVLPHWCPCHTHWAVPVSEPVAQNCGLALIDTINALLLPHKALCAALRMEKVLDARLGKVNDAIQKVDRHVALEDRVYATGDYLVMIRAQPGGGIFEGTVRYDAEGGTYNVLDDIGRLNVYGKQSTCIRNARMRKFCYCKSLTLRENRKDI